MTPPVVDLDAQPLVMSIAQAAAVIGQSHPTAYVQIAAGTWPLQGCIKRVGGRKRVSRYLLEEWLRTAEAAA